MSIVNTVNPPMEELQHYGVKGMKWGTRRTQRQLKDAAKVKDLKGSARSNAIKDARARDASRQAAISQQIHKTNLAKGKKQVQELKKLDKMAKQRISDPDYVNSNYATRGEKVLLGAAYIMVTPVGGLVAGAATVGTRKYKESTQRKVRGS